MSSKPLVEAVGDHLRAKITSKFQTSSFLAGLAVAVLGVQLSTLSGGGRPRLFAVSIALMFGASLLYVAALIKLDELTMPKRFWEEHPVHHADDYTFVLLSDQDLWELRKRMIFYWYTLTLAATGITGFALLLLLVPATWLVTLPEIGPEGTFFAVLLALGLAIVYLMVLSAFARKRFGTLLRYQD